MPILINGLKRELGARLGHQRLAMDKRRSANLETDALDERIPVTLLTGFLGSGKTTALNHLVRQPAFADAIVIINEFGEMALDHLLVAHSAENLVMEMSSGCLCCTIRSDLVKTLQDILWRFARNGQRQFRRVLIETTGLADPAPVIHTLMTHPKLATAYRLDGIVATVDLATGSDTLDRHSEAVKQAAMADVLLLTKADLVPSAQRLALLDRLSAINPAAPRWEVNRGVIAPERVLNLGLYSTDGKTADVERWLRAEAYAAPTMASHGDTHGHDEQGVGHRHEHDHHHEAHSHDVNRHDDRIRAFCFVIDEPTPLAILNVWLDVLMGLLGSKILRVKGVFNIEESDQPVVIHGVQHLFHPPELLPAWPGQDRRSRVVFITQDVSQNTIEASFHAFRKALPELSELTA